jgi:hypothetical protein
MRFLAVLVAFGPFAALALVLGWGGHEPALPEPVLAPWTPICDLLDPRPADSIPSRGTGLAWE